MQGMEWRLRLCVLNDAVAAGAGSFGWSELRNVEWSVVMEEHTIFFVAG